MNNRVNYTFVGSFVLVGIILILSLSYWMLRPSDDAKISQFNIYFDESVLGLNIDAPVKYRGISVGKVTHLKISPNNSEQVEVHISILSSTPIKESTVARLTAQGITGLTYINLTLGKESSPELKKKAGERYPTIKTVPSFFENMEQSLDGLSIDLTKTLMGTHKLLNDKNQVEIANILKNSASLSEKLNKLLDDETITHLQKASENLDSLTYKVDKLMPNIDGFIDKSVAWENSISGSFDSIMQSYVGITASMMEIKRAVASGEFNLKEISSGVVPTMNKTFIDMQQLMIKLDSALKQYKRSPSDMLFKEATIKKAPGEK
jgi:phospholipid/cholesterol/gamma-HCH transport system substrate-binding protein